MPADTWTDIARMAGCVAAVAAAAVPVGWVWHRVARARPPVPVRLSRVRWAGHDVAMTVFVVGLFVPAVVSLAVTSSGLLGHVYGPDDATTPAVLTLWVGLLATPIQLALLVAARRVLGRPKGGSWAADIAAGVWWWAVLTPVVLLVHGGTNALYLALGFNADEHPLTQIGADRPALDHVLFLLQAGVAAPLVEEVLFRGVLLAWLVGGRGGFVERRVWFVLGIAALVAGLTGGERPIGPVAFAVMLLLGWEGLRTRVRKQRTVGGVYASAALFAAIHSAVWPTPIPLFVLGLGLGWVAVRTNGVLAPVIVHGLFNTVSVLFVLSSGAK